MKQFIIAAFILFTGINAIGQTDKLSFIYNTYNEYANNVPSVVLDIENGDIIKYSFPAGLQTRLKTKKKEVIKVYKPGEIWGYKKEGELYRHFGNYKQKELEWEYKIYFKVIYNEDVVVYSTKHIGTIPLRNHTHYYYSKDLKSVIKKANDENLKADFSKEPKVIEKIRSLMVE